MAETDCIRVGVRLRPPVRRSVPRCWARDDDVILKGENTVKNFSFDFACGPNTSQDSLFRRCGLAELLDSVLDGFSVSVLAYGPTGAGKTFTMSGLEAVSGAAAAEVDSEFEGILPRGIRYLVGRVGGAQRAVFRCSYLEVYNDQVFDLLNVSKKALGVRESHAKGFFVPELLEIECFSLQDVLAVAREGARNRRKAGHELNKDSSRSHSIFSVTVVHQEGAEKMCGKANFVDLAGSERIKESKSRDVETVCGINRSLFALGKVISALGDRALIEAAVAAGQGTREDFVGAAWIPYRDSTLTMLLKDALGGSAKALMIACVDPSNPNVHEIESTLGYALRVRDITNAPVRRTVSAADELDEARELNQQLQADLDKCRAEKQELQRRTADLERQLASAKAGARNQYSQEHLELEKQGEAEEVPEADEEEEDKESEGEGPEDDEDEDDSWTEDSEIVELREELQAKIAKVEELDRVVRDLTEAQAQKEKEVAKMDAKLHLRERLSHDLQADVLHLREQLRKLNFDLADARTVAGEKNAAYNAIEIRNHELEEALKNLHRVFLNGGPASAIAQDSRERQKNFLPPVTSSSRPENRELEAENAYLRELVLTLQSEKPPSAGSGSAIVRSKRAENDSDSSGRAGEMHGITSFA